MSTQAVSAAPPFVTARHRGLAVLAAALVVVTLFAATRGAVPIAPREVLSALGARFGLLPEGAVDPQQSAVLFSLRFPRVLFGALAGAALGASGAALQGVFRNALADPGLLGISGGAALCAAVSIVLGVHPTGLGLYAMPLLAFAGALGSAALVWRLGHRDGQANASLLVLAGVAVNALTGAATGALTFAANDAQLRSLTFWTLGSLGGATPPMLYALTPLLTLAFVALVRIAPALDALTLGERDAALLGVSVNRTRRVAIVCAALAAGAVVAFAGVIGFVGLVAPHAARMLLGASHRGVIPGAALLGAVLLLLADSLARTAVSPAELPLGVVCAGFGAPAFLGLLLQRRRGAEGYA